jgi:hypothetical protein
MAFVPQITIAQAGPAISGAVTLAVTIANSGATPLDVVALTVAPLASGVPVSIPETHLEVGEPVTVAATSSWTETVTVTSFAREPRCAADAKSMAVLLAATATFSDGSTASSGPVPVLFNDSTPAPTAPGEAQFNTGANSYMLHTIDAGQILP